MHRGILADIRILLNDLGRLLVCLNCRLSLVDTLGTKISLGVHATFLGHLSALDLKVLILCGQLL